MKTSKYKYVNEIIGSSFNLKNISVNMKLILAISIAFIVIISTIIIIPNQLFKKTIIDINLQSSQERIKAKARIINEFFNELQSEVKLLSELIQLQNIISVIDPHSQNNDSIKNTLFYKENKLELELFFKDIAQSKGHYMQLRYIDIRGNEIVKVDNNNKYVKIASSVQLQNRRDKDYFLASMQMTKNSFYVSEISLHREGGKIKIPLNPIIKYALPVYDEKNRRRGIVIANVFAEKILDEIKELKKEHDFLLLDNNGFYLYHENKNKEWGKDLKTNQSFKIDFPNLSDNILSDKSGLSENQKGIFAHVPIFPLKRNNTYFLILAQKIDKDFFLKKAEKLKLISLLVALIVFFVSIIFIYMFSQSITKPILNLEESIYKMENGELPKLIKVQNKDEIGKVIKAFNYLVKNRSDMIHFANALGKGEYNVKEKFISKGNLATSLIKLRNDLLMSEKETKKRKKEDEIRGWETRGNQKILEIQRKSSNDLKLLCDNILQILIKYIKANQGGLFIYNQEYEQESYLELISFFAFDRKKHLQEKIKIGDGMVGTCALEKKTIYIENLPDDYIKISSGLGEGNPKSLLVVPMLFDNELLGILEIASFQKLKKHEIKFIEMVAKNLASSVSTVQINHKTNKLLEISQKQTDLLSQQEEEMRQNIEEMKSSQEESFRKQKELETLTEELTKSKEELDLKDIKQSKQIEELSLENEKKLTIISKKEKASRAILENSVDAVIVINHKGIVQFFNRSAEKLWGYNKNEVLNKNIKMLMPEKFAKEHDEYLKKYQKTREKNIIGIGREVPILKKNKEISFGLLSVIENKLDNFSIYTGFVKDLSTEKKLEKNQQELLKKITQKSIDNNKEIKRLYKLLEKNNINFKKLVNLKELLIEWDKDFVTGIEKLDLEHKAWLNLLNDFYLLLQDGKIDEKLQLKIEELKVFIFYHIDEEEHGLEKFNSEEKEEIKKEHRIFKQKVCNIAWSYLLTDGALA